MNSGPSFLSEEEVRGLGLRHVGRNVQLSRWARLYFPENITLGDRSRIDDFCIVSARGGVTIGCNVHIGAYCGLFGGSGIVLEDFSGLSPRVSIFTETEDPTGESMTNPTIPSPFRTGLRSGTVSIGRHAVIGAHSVLLPGVTIGEGTIVGAQSVATKSCRPWSLYLGSPVRWVKDLSRERLTLEEAYRQALATEG